MSKKQEEKKSLPTVKVGGGGDYVMVHHRILAFHEMFPNGSLTCKIIEQTENRVTMEAVAIPDTSKPERFFNGYASELKGVGFVNETSHIENCDTSAKGRALATLGIGVEESFASDHEVANAKIQQAEKKAVKGMKSVMQKFIKSFFWANQWLPMAVDLGICKPDAVNSSLNSIFNQGSISLAEEKMRKIDEALLNYHGN